MKLKNSHSKFQQTVYAIMAVISFSFSSYAESLSYSGRLVNSNGSPVAGQVDLKFDLASTQNTSAILCTQQIDDVVLTNGVFHVKLELNCGTPSLSQVLASIASPHAAAIRVTNVTAGKAYSFQELHSVPSAQVAHGLSSLNANNNEVLTWTGSKWEPKPVAGATGGTVKDITAGSGLSGGTITNSGTIAIDIAGVTDTHLAGNISRSKLANGTPNYVLVNNGAGVMSEVAQLPITQGGTGAVTAAAARTNLGIGTIATLSYGAGWDQVIAANLPTCFGTEKLTVTAPPTVTFSCVPDISTDNTKLPLAGGTMTGDIDMGGKTITNLANPVNPGDAANMAYVDAQIGGASVWTKSGTIVSYNSGNVGIGTSTPDQKLHLTSSGSSAQLALERTGAAAGKAYIGADDNGFNVFDSGYVKRLTVSPTGNVGIGTITPMEKLDVVGNAAVSGKLRLKSDNANYVELKAPNALAATLTFNLPGVAGTSGQALITDGSGNLSWATVATGATAVGGDLSGTVTNAQIAVGAIVDADISASAAIAQSKISGLTTDLGNKEPKITAGTASQYWKGDKSWGSLQADVQALVMNGFAVGSNAAVTNADSLSGALGKIQGQINATNTSVAALATSQTSYVLKAGDTMSGNLQMGGNTVTGLAAPSAGTDATTKTYVDTQILNSASKWTLTGNDISNSNSGNVGIGVTNPIFGKSSNTFTRYLGINGTGAAALDSYGALRMAGNQPTAANNQKIGAVQFVSVANVASGSVLGDAAVLATLEGIGGANGFGTALTFHTRSDNTTSTLERMKITNGGAVGIGTSTPGSILHVNTSSGHGGMIVSSPNATNAYIDFQEAGTKKANIYLNGATDTFMVNDVGSVNTVINAVGGNVGIGISPTEKLEVSGNVAVNGKVRMKSDNTNYVELKAPNGLAATTTYTFPATAGTSGYVLTTDGVGALSWTQAATTSTNVGGDLTGTIANAQIAPGAIYNADIANLTITYAKLNLLDGEVPVAKLAPIATITPSNTVIANGDSLTTIANKTQGQINQLKTDSSSYLVKNATDSITGTVTLAGAGALKIPTTPSGADLTDAANVQYVQNYVGTFGQWTKTGANLSYNAGSVGIGIANPWDQFMVYKANNTAAASIVSDNTSTTTARYPSIAVKNFGGGGAGAIGNPVIELVNLRGNSSTSAVVKSGDTLGGISFSGSTNASSAYKEGATIRAIASQNYSTSAAGGMLVFSTTTNSTTTPVDRMVIDQAGSVGIGTVNPTGLLHLNSTGGQMMLLTDSDSLHSDVNYSAYVRGQDFAGNNVWYIGDGSTAAKALNILTYQTGYPITFGTSTGTTMSVVDDKVGIGTTTPTNRLHVEHAVNNAYTAKISNAGGNGQGLLINGSDGDPADTQPMLSVTNYDQSKSMLHVQGNGNVGVGTTTPTAKLEVAGDAKVTGNMYGAVKDTSGTPMRSCVGTSPNSGWVYYNLDAVSTGFCTAYLDINTSACGFSSIFNYFPTLHGDGTHYGTMGATSIYNMTTTGFRVYVTIGGAYNATTCSASGVPHNTLHYFIKWMGVGQ